MLIDRIWKEQPGSFFCLSTKSQAGKWKDHWFTKRELEKVREFIREHRSENVYFCPHGFRTRERTKDAAVLPKLLWSDMDDVDPRSVDFEPSIAIESSPGRFVGLWRLDEPATEELNRRMTYAIGADKSGWDLSQVLRVPGTINYKYASLPKTRLVWGDRAEWSTKELEKKLPKAPREADQFEASDASDIFRKYQRKLRASTRRELMTSREPPEGKRSEVFLRLAFELLEAGLSKDEGCTLLKASVWNKYAGRADEDKQISKSWDKATSKKLVAERTVVGEVNDARAPVRASDLKWTETKWLWYPRIPQDSISLIGARGGSGKGVLCCDIVARVTTGEYWPCSKERVEAGNVLWGEAEDRIEQTVIPRLMAAKADLSKVYFTKPSDFAEYDVREFIKANNIRLIILSPLISFLEGMEDANAAVETRRALEYMDEVIQGTGCAVLGVMHLNKKPDLGAVERLLGSVEFANYPRSVLMLNRDEDEVVRMVHAKFNLGPRAEDLIFKSVNRREKTHPRGQFIGLDWDRPEENINTDSVFDKNADVQKTTTSASEWLLAYLAESGEVECKVVFEAAEVASHTSSAIKRAKLRNANRIRHRRAFGGKVYWALRRSGGEGA